MPDIRYDVTRSLLRLVAQVRPSTATAVTAYAPTLDAVVKEVVVSNQGGGAQKFSIFIDGDGTTYDQTTSLFWDEGLAIDTTLRITEALWAIPVGGNLGIKTDSANSLTFTIFAEEQSTVR